MALFVEDYLRNYIELRNGSPSHDTLRRVMGNIPKLKLCRRITRNIENIRDFLKSFGIVFGYNRYKRSKVSGSLQLFMPSSGLTVSIALARTSSVANA